MQLQHAAFPPLQASAAPPVQLSAIWVRGLLEAVEVAGVSSARFLEAAGLAPEQFTQTYTWVDVEEYDRLLELAVTLTEDPAFGLHWSQRSPFNKLDVFTILAANAPNLRAALDSMLSFQEILWRRSEIDAVDREGALFVRYRPAGSELGRRVRSELTIYGIVRLLRYAGFPEQAVRRVSFAHEAPSYAGEYMSAYAVAPMFDQPVSGVEIAQPWLERPLGDANTELYHVLKSQAHRVLDRIQRSTGYAGRMRDYLAGVLPHLPDMPETARVMGLSVRSLRRRLADEGSSYTQLVEEAQYDLARQLLQDPTRAIKQIGFDVGFTTAAAFDRAFKRWTGESPAVYRKAQFMALSAS